LSFRISANLGVPSWFDSKPLDCEVTSERSLWKNMEPWDSAPASNGIDDTLLRNRLWKSLFGDQPMPVPSMGAVDGGLGLLDHGVTLSNDEAQRVEKMLKSLDMGDI